MSIKIGTTKKSSFNLRKKTNPKICLRKIIIYRTDFMEKSEWDSPIQFQQSVQLTPSMVLVWEGNIGDLISHTWNENGWQHMYV